MMFEEDYYKPPFEESDDDHSLDDKVCEFTLGITYSNPKEWLDLEPLWDEKLTVTSNKSFSHVMYTLCNTVIKSRRQHHRDNSYGKYDHLWNMKVSDMTYATKTTTDSEDMLLRMLAGLPSHSAAKMYKMVCCQGEMDFFNWDEKKRDIEIEGGEVIGEETRLSEELLPPGTVIHVKYDYGSTTSFYMKVLDVKSGVERSLLEYTNETSCTPASEVQNALKSVPTYGIAKEEQIDHFFPHASRAFLRGGIGSSTLGFMEDNSVQGTFCTIENQGLTQDLLLCPAKQFNLNELFQVIDKVWGKTSRAGENIQRWICAADKDEQYKRMKKDAKKQSGGFWGGAEVKVYRLPKDGKKSSFDFDQVYPKTYAMLSSGKHRWFQYKHGVLRVIVGRANGHDNRQVERKQILKTWSYKFTTLHELLSAVEASWFWEGKELTPDACLPDIDVPNPYWNEDGSPTKLQRRRCKRLGMDVDVSDSDGSDSGSDTLSQTHARIAELEQEIATLKAEQAEARKRLAQAQMEQKETAEAEGNISSHEEQANLKKQRISDP